MAEHARLNTVLAQLNELEHKSAESGLNRIERIELARLTASAGKTEYALSNLRSLKHDYPEDSEILFSLGLLLLAEKDEAGIAELQIAMDQGGEYGYMAALILMQYYIEEKRESEAEAYVDRINELGMQLRKLNTDGVSLTREDKFEPHNLSPAKLRRLQEILHEDPRVKQAYLVRKALPGQPGEGQPVLVLRLGSPHWYPVDMNELATLCVADLSQTYELRGFLITTWEGIKSNLGSACKKLPNAYIYNRSQWKPYSGTATGLAEMAEVSWPKSNFFIEHRAVLLMFVGIVLFFLWASTLSYVPQTVHEALTGTRRVSKPSDEQLRTWFVQHKQEFIDLKNKLISDPSLESISDGTLNGQVVDQVGLASAVEKAGITQESYREYLRKLNDIGCSIMTYGGKRGADGRNVTDRDQILFFMWYSEDLELKAIMFLQSDEPPMWLPAAASTEQIKPLPGGTYIMGCVKLSPNWYIFYQKVRSK